MSKISAIAPLPEGRYEEPPSEDETIDIRPYLRSLWHRRLIIALVTLACGSVGLAWGLTTGRSYEAAVALTVTRSKMSTSAGTDSDATTANFRPYIENESIASTVIRELGLDKPPHNLSPSTFFNGVVTVTEVKNSTVLKVAATLDDPNMVARVVNRVAEMASNTARAVSQQQALRARDDVKLQLDEARIRRQDAEGRLAVFRDTSQIEVLRKDADSALGQRGSLLALLIQIEVEKAKLASAEHELAARQRTETVKRSIDSDPTMIEAARTSANQPSELLGLEVRNELVNPVYQGLDQQVAASRTTLAALERQKSQLVDVRKLGGEKLDKVTQLNKADAELSRLELERDIARRIYTDLATTYETARLQVASRSSDLQIISPAIPPDRPVSRRVARTTLIALLVGFSAGSLFVLAHRALTTDVPRTA